MIISKTTFLDFLYCPKNTWLKLYKPELYSQFTLSEFEKHLIEQGNEVEFVARDLFPGGIEIVATGDDAIFETLRLITLKIPAIFQSTFIVDNFMVKNDILAFDNKNNCWNMYEVKGTNSLKENCPDHDHIDDMTFQASVLKRAKIKVGHYFIIHLNKEYKKNGNIDIHELFKIEDETDKVLTRLSDIEKQMEIAKKYLEQNIEPLDGCDCIYRGRKKHCATFEYSNPNIPKYSVHDLSRVSKNKLNNLIESEIYNLNDIPDNFKLTNIQQNQVLVHKKQKPIIDIKKIKDELDNLRFPLYFFDYEAFGPAIPVFDGFRPYQRIPFQFSLHILKTPQSELEHIEYLHEKLTDPTVNVAKMLEKHISPMGTVIVWHKSFEESLNNEIAECLSDYSTFFKRMNNSLYDLEDIFKNQHYVHHGFKGSSSIKKVLPVIASELDYSNLEIHEGGQAADAWWVMLSPITTSKQKKKISKDLKTYCGLDTYAMYAIWRFLYNLKN